MGFQLQWSFIISTFIMVMCLFYLWEMARSYRKQRFPALELDGVEGFRGDAGGGVGGVGGLDERVDDDCYDRFYAKVYDSLVQPVARAPTETKVALEFMKRTSGREATDLRIADIGSGTGLHVDLFAKAGAREVIGYDRSTDMIAEAKRKYPNHRFELGDATKATMCAADQFDLITMYYFTIYTVPDRAQMLKNIYLWLAPGGVFCCHIVNKQKFDPILESASPFVGFSLQKYVKDRATTSKVNFKEFDYKGDFQLHGSRGVYEEEFDFKDGRFRKHQQRVWMPTIEALVSEIEGVGFKVAHHEDLTAIGYEYQFLFFFQK